MDGWVTEAVDPGKHNYKSKEKLRCAAQNPQH